MLTACVVAVFTYFPLYKALVVAANPAMAAAIEQAPVTVVADAGECSFQFDPIGRNKFDGTSCDIVKAYLARSGVNYANVAAAPGTAATVRIGGEVHKAPDPATLTGEAKADAIAVFQQDLHAGLTRAGYPAAAAPDPADKGKVIAILCIFGLLATMVYGPLAALLVEIGRAHV